VSVVVARARRGSGESADCLLLTASSSLGEQVSRAAVVARARVEVATAPAEARRRWTQAPLVLVGGDVAASLRQAPSRRGGVVLLSEHGSPEDYRLAVAVGAEHVAVLPEAAGWLVQRMADAAEGVRAGPVVAVLGARGGVGATTLLAALGRAAVGAGLATVLVDADPLGAGLDLLLDSGDEPGLRWHDLALTQGRLPSGSLAEALPRADGLALLTAAPGRPAEPSSAALGTVLPALARGHDLVLVDLPRRLDDPARAALRRCRTTLLVVPADPRSVAGAALLAPALAADCADVRLAVRAAGGDPQEVERVLGCPVAGVLRHDPRLARHDREGDPLPRRPWLGRTCRGLLGALAPVGVEDA
jgi:secretion/DNA translocation related CpaE-like protein